MMKRSIHSLMALIVFAGMNGLAAAQHGRPAGAGRPTTPGGASGAGADRGGRPSADGSTSHSSAAKTPGELLSQNTKLSSKLSSLLPAGTDLRKASSGFKNLGQFVAAVHVSHNLGIPFDDLKAKMTAGESLGQAIHELKPAADASAEAKKAQKQSRKDLNEAHS